MLDTAPPKKNPSAAAPDPCGPCAALASGALVSFLRLPTQQDTDCNLDTDFFCDTVTEVSGSNEPWTRYISVITQAFSQRLSQAFSKVYPLGLAFCFLPFVIHSQLRWSPRFFDLFMLLRGLLIQIPTFSQLQATVSLT